MAEDRKARESVEHASKAAASADRPAAGPHAKEHLIDRDKTPGTGSLPEPDARETDAGPD
ncbi:hypothetical protein ACFFP0_02875 [Rhizobium puerariae]|uniref:Uncharacterized protein n=1 Tax=Rhizobium puerariae TaxID=1585791 RepID=A0ABV6AAX7_9HYPH